MTYELMMLFAENWIAAGMTIPDRGRPTQGDLRFHQTQKND